MITHAFFKALLFLGSGSVIHGMHHEQDMRRMGALRKLMPVTAITFIIGWLAIAGVPPFAGFWSKDEILLYVYANNRFLYVVGLVTALLTAYYMTRQVIMVFYGKAKWNDHASDHGDRARRDGDQSRGGGATETKAKHKVRFVRGREVRAMRDVPWEARDRLATDRATERGSSVSVSDVSRERVAEMSQLSGAGRRVTDVADERRLH